MYLSQSTQRFTEEAFDLSVPPDKPKHLLLHLLSVLCELCERRFDLRSLCGEEPILDKNDLVFPVDLVYLGCLDSDLVC